MVYSLRPALILAALIATPAIVQAAPATTQVIVRIADLDLATESGQRLLERRLATAVDDACGGASMFDLAGSNDVRRCREEVRASISAKRTRLISLARRSPAIALAAR